MPSIKEIYLFCWFMLPYFGLMFLCLVGLLLPPLGLVFLITEFSMWWLLSILLWPIWYWALGFLIKWTDEALDKAGIR